MLNDFGMERIAEQSWNSSYTYQVSKHSAEMLHNLNIQRKDGGRFCDVILRVGEDSFPAHKAVLAACSEYFESVFGCQTEGDGEAKELEMHTISPKVFKDILDFAYTSRIVVRLECFPELMTAAKFLLMRSVIEICQEVIKQSNVQILVPPSRRGDVSLFRATGGSEFSFTLAVDNMSNGNGLLANGNNLFTNNGQPHNVDGNQANDTVMSDGSPQSAMPVLQPVSPSEMTGNPFQEEGSSGSKRGRGRPKKGTAMEPINYNISTSDVKEDIEQLFPCGICGKAFTEAVRLRNHEAQHGASSHGASSSNCLSGEGGPTSISHSGQPGLLENGMPLHGGVGLDNSRKRERTRRHVGCDICGKVFRDVYHLNRHKLSHSGEKPYACHVCGLRFKRKDRMSYHVRSHDGSVGKPYVCQSCGKGFSRPDHLNGHIKQVHTTERPHKCQICNASFATRDRLRSHLACHEDKIPCQMCGKYLRAAYMTDHLKKHSEGPHNYCGICNKGFSTASYLKVHVKSHHGSPLFPRSAPAHGAFPAPHGEPQMHGGAPYHTGRQCTVEDLCTSRRLLVTFPEADGHCFLPQPGPPSLGLQPELLLGKPGPGGAPYFWECHSAGPPGFHPLHGPLPDGRENAGKCTHQGESEGDEPSFGGEMKSPHKSEEEELGTPFACNGASASTGAVGGSPPGDVKAKTSQDSPEKKFPCSECTQTFRTKSYLNKHVNRVHHHGVQKSLVMGAGAVSGSGLGELGPSLGSPFSPQQNMSLLESFGFQIVQSAFASSLVDSEAGHSGMELGGK